MWFLVIILNALAKNIIPLIRQKSFLEKTKKGGWARDAPTEGGSGGGIPPGIHTYRHHKPKLFSFVDTKAVASRHISSRADRLYHGYGRTHCRLELELTTNNTH